MKQLIVFLFVLTSAFPVFANTAAVDEQNVDSQAFVEEQNLGAADLLDQNLFTEEEEVTADADNKAFVKCTVHAKNRFGHIFGRFHSFKHSRFHRCVRGFNMCRKFMKRTHKFGFCQEHFNRFPRHDDDRDDLTVTE